MNPYQMKLEALIAQLKATAEAIDTEPTEAELEAAEQLDDATVDRLWGEIWHNVRKLNRRLKRALAGNS